MHFPVLNHGKRDFRKDVSSTMGFMVENVGGDDSAPAKKQPTRVVKIGRNDLCPCGSGLKWKKCTCAEYHQDN